MNSTSTIESSVINFEKIFIITWLSVLYSIIGAIVSFSFIFFYEFFRIIFNSNSILAIIITAIIIMFLFGLFTFIPLIIIFGMITIAKYIIKNKMNMDINSMKNSMISSTKNKIFYYYIIPNLFFQPLAFSLFDLNIIYAILLTIITLLLRNLLDFFSDELVKNKN